jgi:abhydrolase domain-containing protein 17
VPIIPSEAKVYNDVLAVYEHLNKRLGIQPSNIILYGRSVGSGPTCFLGQKLSLEGTPCAGIILQSPLLSAYRVAFNFRFTMAGDVFPNIDRIGEINSPIFIIHGTRDEVVPFWHGQELFLATQRKYRARPFWVTGAGHNNVESLLRSTTAFHDHIRFFIDQWCSNNENSIQAT